MHVYWNYLFGALLASTVITVVIMKLLLMRTQKKKLRYEEEYIRTSSVYHVGQLVLYLTVGVTWVFTIIYYVMLAEKVAGG